MASHNRIAIWLDSPSLEHQGGEFIPSALIDPQLGDAYESLPQIPLVRASALPVTAYTAGDTKDPGFQRLETPALAQNPSRVRRRYAPLRREEFSGLRSPDPVFPNLEIDSGRFAYPLHASRPTTLMELFHEEEANSSEHHSPVLDDDLVPVNPVAAMLARQMGLVVHDWEFQSMDTVEPILIHDAEGSPVEDPSAVQTPPQPTAVKSSIKTAVNAQPVIQEPRINLITDPTLAELTTETDTHQWTQGNRTEHQGGFVESPAAAPWSRADNASPTFHTEASLPFTTETSIPTRGESGAPREVMPETEVEVLRESLQQSRRQVAQMESRQQESERIAVSRAEKRIRDRLRAELPPPPPEEVAPGSRGAQVSMKPISEPLDSASLVPDPLETPVTIREMQIIQQQQAINESAMRQQIVKELRSETETKIERAQKEAEALGRSKLKVALRKIINS
jgi:hypothetical protein